jgi:NAD dependent epimerase/dehydratase family enzyme
MNGRYYIPFYVPSFILKLVLGQRSIEVLKSATLSCRKILDTGFTFSFTGIEAALDDLVKK